MMTTINGHVVHIATCQDFTVTDENGRDWRFDWHPYCGPTVLKSNGEPRKHQPGPNSPFWAAFRDWLEDFKDIP